jgi:formylglycine-generating enzyme required for sulfatase activity
VGSFAANTWQLYDMHGNVREWVADCRHDSYAGAPSDGSSWTGNCGGDRYMQRGGGWTNYAQGTRSAIRENYSPDSRFDDTGFRIARALSGP